MHPADPSHSAAPRGFQLPADYYSTPVTSRPLVPRWVPIGCGVLSLLFMLVLFAGGALVAQHGIGGLFDFIFANLERETADSFDKDVTAAQRAAFAAEMKTARDFISDGRLDLKTLQPVMNEFGDAASDDVVTSAETAQITKMLHEANARAAKQPVKKKS